MTMWKFKSCPRCRGDLFIGEDIDGWYAQCLQCSYRRDLKITANHKKYPVATGETGGKNWR